jgi:hypothetical protein
LRRRPFLCHRGNQSRSHALSTPVPRFYFHIFDDVVCRDDEGRDLTDIGAARAAARDGAIELMSSEIRGGHLILEHRIEVENEAGEIVFILPFHAVATIS